MTLTGNPTLVDPGFKSPPDNPLILFQRWMDEAIRLNVNEPIEFWQGSPDRFHKRLRYDRREGVWSNLRLQP